MAIFVQILSSKLLSKYCPKPLCLLPLTLPLSYHPLITPPSWKADGARHIASTGLTGWWYTCHILAHGTGLQQELQKVLERFPSRKMSQGYGKFCSLTNKKQWLIAGSISVKNVQFLTKPKFSLTWIRIHYENKLKLHSIVQSHDEIKITTKQCCQKWSPGHQNTIQVLPTQWNCFISADIKWY